MRFVGPQAISSDLPRAYMRPGLYLAISAGSKRNRPTKIRKPQSVASSAADMHGPPVRTCRPKMSIPFDHSMSNSHWVRIATGASPPRFSLTSGAGIRGAVALTAGKLFNGKLSDLELSARLTPLMPVAMSADCACNRAAGLDLNEEQALSHPFGPELRLALNPRWQLNSCYPNHAVVQRAD